MLLIFLSWLYIIFTTINFGVLTDRIIVLNNKNFVITSFLGLFSITFLASIWAIFGRINIEFHVAILIANFFIYIKFTYLIFDIYKSFWISLKKLSAVLKFYLILITLFIIAQCSTLPYIIDNESYYIQTIKWLNEYGFVKGIINLHLFLGQNSGWHVAQSVFNFSFLYKNFNDLSGYALLLGIYFSIEKLNDYDENRKLHYLVVGTLPLASIYFFPFINAPSPDIPVYMLTFMILFYFIENFKNCKIEVFNLIVLFVLFLLYIKNTTFIFILIPVILLFKNYAILKAKLCTSSVISALILILFVAKNLITCGSPIFLFNFFNFSVTDYALPKHISDLVFTELKYHTFAIGKNAYNSLTASELILRWLTLPKLTGLFNKISFILIVVTPAFIYKFQNKQKYWILYGLMVFQLIALFATSPQYRFFMNFILFFGLFCIICIVRNKKIITLLLLFSLVPIGYIIFIPMKLFNFTNNKLMSETSTVPLKAIVFPLENTKLKSDFELIELGNMKYNSPIENNFLYGTGNGDLPCVNKKQIDYYKKRYSIIPQMRTNELKDGFYSKKIKKDE
jgi:hypothetical protein